MVEAIEDKEKRGIVLYDPRADWKLKADLIVIINGRAIRVSSFFGDPFNRPGVEARRDVIERQRKQNTMESSHWDNAELAAMTTLQISRTEADHQVAKGLRLFSQTAIDKLLSDIHKAASGNAEGVSASQASAFAARC